MTAVNFQGVIPPAATPFTADGDVDFDAIRFNVDRWMHTGLRGLLLLGSNGEAPYVDEDEAVRIVAAARDGVPRDRVLLVGTGRDATRATIAASVRAVRAGADAVLVRPPSAFKSNMTNEALVAHYTAVADASPVPVLLYNFAAAFGVNLATEVILALAEHRNIIGLKESGGDLAQIGDQVARTPDDFVVVVGSAPTMYASLCVGVDGAVVAAANVIPDLMVKLHALTTEGRHREALHLQRAITPLARGVTAQWGVPALKAAMTLAGYRGGSPRMPLAPAPPAVVESLRRMLDTLAI